MVSRVAECNNFEFSMLPSEFLQLSLRVGPLGTLGSCKVTGEDGERKELVLLNSGDSILVFDLAVTLSRGISGLIRVLNLHQDILPALLCEKAGARPEGAKQHPVFLQ